MSFPFTLSSGAAPRAIVFDLDETLIAGDSTVLWTEWLYETKTVSDPFYRDITARMVEQYQAGVLNIQDFLHNSLTAIQHLKTSELDRLIELFVQNKILPRIYPQGIKLLANATLDAIPVIIISATASFIVKPIAAKLGIHEAIGIDLATKNSLPTGDIIGIPSFREGKVLRLAEWLDHKNQESDFYGPPLTAADVFFFTDSHNDLSLACLAGGCALVNPDSAISKEGKKYGWYELKWSLQ